MLDPTGEELFASLIHWDCGEDNQSKEIAIYYFAEAWHSGQNSNLYEVLCNSPYKPGPIARLSSENDVVNVMYEDLVRHFGKNP